VGGHVAGDRLHEMIQVESPPSVASGLQRAGRAKHHVGDDLNQAPASLTL